jgi:glycosyltransferase involved in cell wall biosynthesis
VGSDVRDPDYVSRLKGRFSSLIQQERLRFLGGMSHDEVRGELASCAVYCLPSFWEASPLSAVEAMAMGKPVVVSRVGDLPEILAGEDAGLLVNAGDSAGLTEALRTLLSDGPRRDEMGRRAREVAIERCRLDRVAHQTLDACREIIAQEGIQPVRVSQ